MFSLAATFIVPCLARCIVELAAAGPLYTSSARYILAVHTAEAPASKFISDLFFGYVCFLRDHGCRRSVKQSSGTPKVQQHCASRSAADYYTVAMCNCETCRSCCLKLRTVPCVTIALRCWRACDIPHQVRYRYHTCRRCV